MKKLLVLIFSIFAITAANAEGFNTFVVKLTDGSTNKFLLSEQPKITLPENSVVLTTNSVNVEYDRSEVEKFYFEYTTDSSVEAIECNTVAFKYDDKNVTISGLGNNNTVSVFSAEGKCVYEVNTNGSSDINISLEGLQKGVYVINFDNRSVKITR